MSNTPSNEPLAHTAQQHIRAAGPGNEAKLSNCLELAAHGRPPSLYSVEKIRLPLTLSQKAALTRNEKIELPRRAWKRSYYVSVLPSTASNFLRTFSPMPVASEPVRSVLLSFSEGHKGHKKPGPICAPSWWSGLGTLSICGPQGPLFTRSPCKQKASEISHKGVMSCLSDDLLHRWLHVPLNRAGTREVLLVPLLHTPLMRDED